MNSDSQICGLFNSPTRARALRPGPMFDFLLEGKIMKNPGIDTSPSNGAHQAIDRISDAVHPAVSRAASGAHHLVDSISGTSSRLAHGLERTACRVIEAEQRLVGASSNYVRENPFKSAGFALAAGFLVSQLVSSRKSSDSYDKA